VTTALGTSTITLALVAGYAGSGKSEAGKLLAAATGWAMLDKDTLSRPMTERLLQALGGDPDDRHSPTYLEHARPLEYACLMKAVWEKPRVRHLRGGGRALPRGERRRTVDLPGGAPLRQNRGPLRDVVGGQ
jgi:hypothetical protein